MAPSSLPVSGPSHRSTSWSVHNGLLDVEAQSVTGTSDSDLKLESDDEVRATSFRRSVHEGSASSFSPIALLDIAHTAVKQAGNETAITLTAASPTTELVLRCRF